MVIRLSLMPFTMHGQDIVFINYFPMMCAKEGVWDPYGFIATNFSYFPYTYYGPVTFVIFSVFNFIYIKLLGAASLVRLLEIGSTMLFKGLATFDYVNALSRFDLFKNLFLMKVPYLIFDLLIAAMILKLPIQEKAKTASYKIWMLNIVVLHSAYAIGTFDIITAFFVMAALYAAINKRPYLSIIFLSLGGGTKLFPYALILPASLLLGNNWKKRVALLLTGGITSALPYAPFYFLSGKTVLDFFKLPNVVQYSGDVRIVLGVIFLISYCLISIQAVRDSAKKPVAAIIYYFLTILFLVNSIFPTRLRYFTVLTPLLALIIPRQKRFGLFMLFIIMILALSHATGREQQMGLFMPLNAEYFRSLPALQETIGRFTDIGLIYKVLARLSPIAFFISALWVWRMKRDDSLNKEGEYDMGWTAGL